MTESIPIAPSIEEYYRWLRRQMARGRACCDESAMELSFNLVHTFDLWENRVEALARREGITLPGFNVLSILNQQAEDGLPLNKLGRLLLVTRANVTGLVDSLAAKGFVRRIDDDSDRRIRRAAITKAGAKLLDSYLPHHMKEVAAMSQALSGRERKTLIGLLTKLRKGFAPLALLALAALPLSAATSLSISQAMELANRNHVDIKLAKARTEEARGKALEDAADLLPQVMGTVQQARVFKINLAAEGLGSFPGLAPLLGPFNVFDARVRIVQTVLDVKAIQKARASHLRPSIARAQEQLAREQVAAAAALSYLESLRADKAVATAQASADLAHKLMEQVGDQRKAGSAAGIDVARARTRAAEEDLRLLQARADAQDASTKLKRVIGLPLSGVVQLTDLFQFSGDKPDEGPLDAVSAVATAFQQRAEIRVVEEQASEERLALSSEKWTNAPAIAAAADYGLSGNSLGDSHGTGSIGVQATIPLLTKDTVGHKTEAQGKADEADARASDMRAQVEEDVRLALDKLATSAQRVKTSEEAVRLADSELQMARDRFSAGVGENIDVVSAQAARARIEDAYIASIANYQATRINLAMALGNAAGFHF